ncbi:WD40 repeat-like protein, partial [Coemansia sp. RSA 2424]
YDGKLCTWDLATGIACSIEGAKTNAKPEDIAAAANNTIALGFIDDAVRFARDSKMTGAAAGLGAAPVSLAIDSSGATVVAALANGDLALVSLATQQATKVPGSPAQAVAISHASVVAVGYGDNSVRLFQLANGTLAPTGVSVTANTRPITRLAFSPDGQLLAAGDAGGKIVVARADTGEIVTTRWGAHTARIYGLAWSPDNEHAASSSLDGHVIVWSTTDPLRKTIIKNAHLGGASAVAFVDSQTVVSTGADGGVKCGSRSPSRYQLTSRTWIAANSDTHTPRSMWRTVPVYTLLMSDAVTVPSDMVMINALANRSMNISRRLIPPNNGSSMNEFK